MTYDDDERQHNKRISLQTLHDMEEDVNEVTLKYQMRHKKNIQSVDPSIL